MRPRPGQPKRSLLSEDDSSNGGVAGSPAPLGEDRDQGLNHSTSLNLALVLLFLIPRLALLYAREPFFDALFTRWISAHSYAGILPASRLASGPPLYNVLDH